MKSIIYFLIAIVPVLGFGQHCTNDTRYTEVDYFNNSDVDTLKNVVYGQAIDWLGSNKVLKMDIYLPKASADPFTARPAVMMIHGGGFYKGSKGTRAKECVALAKRGFVAFSIAYRLGWDSLNPADQLNATYRAQQDANAAMRYMVANRLTYEVDTNWLFVAGSSAGAATALNMVYASQSEWNTVVPGIENNLGSLDTSGNNITTPFSIKGIYNNWGGTYSMVIQPSDMVPMISYHGLLDTKVPIDSASSTVVGSRNIHNKLVANGVCSRLYIDSLGGHGIYGGSNGAIFRSANASCFFKSLFCSICTDLITYQKILSNCSVLTGMDDSFENEGEIVAFPNPFNESVTISFEKELTGDHDLLVYNIVGMEIIKQEKVIGSQVQIQQNDLGEGLFLAYLVNNKTKQRKFVAKLIAQE